MCGPAGTTYIVGGMKGKGGKPVTFTPSPKITGKKKKAASKPKAAPKGKPAKKKGTKKKVR